MMVTKYHTESEYSVKGMKVINFISYAYVSNEFIPKKYQRPKTKLLISAYELMCFYINLMFHLRIDKFTPSNSKDIYLGESTTHQHMRAKRPKYKTSIRENIEDLFEYYMKERKEIEI